MLSETKEKSYMHPHISTRVGQPRHGEVTPHITKSIAKHARATLGLRDTPDIPSDPGSMSVEQWKQRKQQNGK